MAETKAVSANLSIVGANSISPKYFWKGKELTEVKTGFIQTNINGGIVRGVVRLKVQDTANFDTEYAEMTAEGININKI